MALTFTAGTPVESTGSVTSTTVALPAGIGAGDYTIICVALNVSNGGVTTPAGWTDILPSTATVNGSASCKIAVFYRKWVSGDGSVAITTNNGRVGAVPIRVQGAHQTSFVDVTSAVSQLATTITTLTAPAITPTSGWLMNVFGARNQSNGVFLTPFANLQAGITEAGSASGKSTTQTNAGVLLTYDPVTPGVDTGTRTADAAAVTTGALAFSFSLNEAAVGGPGEVIPPPATATAMARVPVVTGLNPSLIQRVSGIAIPPTTSGVVSVRVADTTSVRLKVGTNAAVTTGIIFGSAVTPGANGEAKLTVSGLTAGTQYYYRVEMNGTLDTDATVGKFKTAPSGVASFNFCFSSCELTGAEGAIGLDAVAARQDDIFFHLGDLYYHDGSGTTLTNFRNRMNTKIALHQNAFATTNISYLPSDHDGMNNNSTGTTDPTAWANFATVFGELFPMPSIYYAFTWGRVRFVQLDTRTYKSDPADADTSSKTNLGATQKQWLKDEITNATEPIIIILQDAPWPGNPTAGDDGWMGYTTERTEIGNHFAASGKKIIVLGGDMHSLGADDGSNSPGGTPVFMASPLNNNSSRKGGPWSQGTYPPADAVLSQQYGRCVVTDTGASISVAYTGYSAPDNTARITLTVTVQTGAVAAVPATATALARVPVVAISGAVSAVRAQATAMARVPVVSGAQVANVAGVRAMATAAAPAPAVLGAQTATVAGVKATATALAMPPAVTALATVVSVKAAATALALAPSVSIAPSIAAVTASATSSANAPTVTALAVVTAVRAIATATGIAPAVSAGGAATVTAVTAHATVIAVTPAFTSSVAVTGVRAQSTAMVLAPTVGVSVTVVSVRAQASSLARVPAISHGVNLAAARSAATAQMTAPFVAGGGAVTVNAVRAAATAGGAAPLVSVPAGVASVRATGSAVARVPAASAASVVSGVHAQASASAQAPVASVEVVIAVLVVTATALLRAPTMSGQASLVAAVALASALMREPIIGIGSKTFLKDGTRVQAFRLVGGILVPVEVIY